MLGGKEGSREHEKAGWVCQDGGWGLFKDTNPITLTELGRPSSEGSREEEIGCGLIRLPVLPGAESKYKQVSSRIAAEKLRSSRETPSSFETVQGRQWLCVSLGIIKASIHYH
jgi:hypothetical protein